MLMGGWCVNGRVVCLWEGGVLMGGWCVSGRVVCLLLCFASWQRSKDS